MPKLIDYPRTSYTGAWEVAEVVDDTGGKCALETCARKLNRKVSGSFKAIVGSGVKFGLLTSKREQLATTTLFRRIKHAYDKQEELLFHREAFLTPPLFTQLCRKFRSRELPIGMLDVLLIREFEVEEINAQSVSKAFVEGARMVRLLDEKNIMADIDQLANAQPIRRELASLPLPENSFRASDTEDQLSINSATQTIDRLTSTKMTQLDVGNKSNEATRESPFPDRHDRVGGTNLTKLRQESIKQTQFNEASLNAPITTATTSDVVANLFGLSQSPGATRGQDLPLLSPGATPPLTPTLPPVSLVTTLDNQTGSKKDNSGTDQHFKLELSGPGIHTQLDLNDPDDLILARALLNKVERLLSLR